MIRSTVVTLGILSCAAVVLTAMGHIYSVTELNAYGRQAVAFYVGPDSITLFGKEIYLPIFIPFQRFLESAKLYSSGIIKLLGLSVEATEELLLQLFS